MRDVKDTAFFLLIVATTLAFLWILWPFSGAILWGGVLAILFARPQRWLVKLMKQRRTPAAILNEIIIISLVIAPLMWVGSALVEEASSLYQRLEGGQLDLTRYLRTLLESLPVWATNMLDRAGLTDLDAVRERLSSGLMQATQFIAARIVNIGQSTASFILSLFVMLYLLFFLLRDGDQLASRIRDAIPLQPEQKRALFERFTTTTRATIKGSIVVAILQGALGGLIFWLLGVDAPLLWGVVMAVLSLVPVLGAGLVWAPVAIYFLATGETLKGIVLLAYGVLVISLVDNVVRPMLVGKDAKMPDYIVLIATLGGIAMVGVNGFLLGPMIAAMFLAVWEILSREQ